MSKSKQQKEMCIGNTTFLVTSNFVGNVELQHLIKRLISSELGFRYCR